MKNINELILKASYWEHFKAAKDMALYMEPEYPKRIAIDKAMAAMLLTINASPSQPRYSTPPQP